MSSKRSARTMITKYSYRLANSSKGIVFEVDEMDD